MSFNTKHVLLQINVTVVIYYYRKELFDNKFFSHLQISLKFKKKLPILFFLAWYTHCIVFCSYIYNICKSGIYIMHVTHLPLPSPPPHLPPHADTQSKKEKCASIFSTCKKSKFWSSTFWLSICQKNLSLNAHATYG